MEEMLIVNDSQAQGLFYSVAIVGSSGAWTGFTLNLSGTLYGAFGWIAIG